MVMLLFFFFFFPLKGYVESEIKSLLSHIARIQILAFLPLVLILVGAGLYSFSTQSVREEGSTLVDNVHSHLSLTS